MSLPWLSFSLFFVNLQILLCQNYTREYIALSFRDADSYCSFHHGSSLCSIHNDNQMMSAAELTENVHSWIGLNDINDEGNYYWTDTSPFNYGTNLSIYPWDDGEPNNAGTENCIHFAAASLKWNDRDCNNAFQFLCNYPKYFYVVHDNIKHQRHAISPHSIGTINILDELIVTFDFIVYSYNSNVTASLLSIYNVMTNKLLPDIALDASTQSLLVNFDGNIRSSANNALTLNILHHFELHATQNSLISMIDNSTIHNDHNIASHFLYQNQNIYVNGPLNGYMTNLNIATSNSYINPFNYLCDYNNRFSVFRGSWSYDESNCRVEQSLGYSAEFYSMIAWLGEIDSTSMDWTDYKIEIVVNVQSGKEAGLIFRAQKPDLYYSCTVNPTDGVICGVINPDWTELNTQYTQIDYYTDITLRIEAISDSFAIYVNNEYFFTMNHGVFSSGSIGLMTWQGTAIYKSVRITFPNNNNVITFDPTISPTNNPTDQPTNNPTYNPTVIPTVFPTNNPTNPPSTALPTTANPTSNPTHNPTSQPTISPITSAPTMAPITTSPTISQPTAAPTTAIPTASPPTTAQPTTATTSVSSKTKSVTATNQILAIIVAIFIVICCFLLVVLCRRHKQQQKQKSIVAAMKRCGSSNDSSAPEIIQSDESSVDELELYKKPPLGTVAGNATAGRSVTTGGDQQNEIVHFYYTYMDSAEEPNIDCTDDNLLYHEKQAWEMCLMHALNALLQKKEFSIKSMNEICKELAPNKLINPHKSVLQTGNYDANVLMMALTKINIEVEWFDARKANELDLNDDTFLRYLKGENKRLVGFILNNPQKAMFKMLSRRHWIAIKQINGVWYNLDSKLQAPKELEVDALTAFLVDNLRTNNAELMICRKENKFIQRKVEMNVAINW